MMASGDEKELHTLERASGREVFKPKKCTAGNERPGVLATCAKMLYKKQYFTFMMYYVEQIVEVVFYVDKILPLLLPLEQLQSLSGLGSGPWAG